MLHKSEAVSKCILHGHQTAIAHHREKTVDQCQQNELETLRAENTVLRKQLERCQKMTALGELVSTTTHEFNNVLMTIMNWSKNGMRYEDKETRDKAFSKISEASNRAAKITKSVLGMARNRSEHFEKTDLAKIIDETMVLLERELQKYRISVEVNLGREHSRSCCNRKSDSTGTAQPADQRSSGNARRRKTSGSIEPRRKLRRRPSFRS